MDTKVKNRYRNRLIRANTVTIAIISLVEIFAYIMLVSNKSNDFSIQKNYLLFCVIIPILINILENLTVRIVNKHSKCSDDVKNEITIYGITVTAIVVSLCHRDFIVTSCAYVVPIVLSAIFNKRNLLEKTLSISFFSLTIIALLLWNEEKLTHDNFINIIVAYCFIVVSYLIGYIFCEYSSSNSTLIENQAIANNQLQSQAFEDLLTGLLNRRGFFTELEREFKKAKDNAHGFCLAMIDVDNFKKVNDRFGHKRGDEVLATLAKILDNKCGINDSVCRYGGEEFTVIFKNKTISEASENIKNALECFRDTKYPFTEESITFSCGIVEYNGEDSKELLIDRVDKCMYAAKNNGKNQIAIHEQQSLF